MSAPSLFWYGGEWITRAQLDRARDGPPLVRCDPAALERCAGSTPPPTLPLPQPPKEATIKRYTPTPRPRYGTPTPGAPL